MRAAATIGGMRGAKTYRFVVAGDPADVPADLIEQATIRTDNGATTITGPITDQSQLHAVLRRLADVGCGLVEMEQLGTAPPATVDGA